MNWLSVISCHIACIHVNHTSADVAGSFRTEKGDGIGNGFGLQHPHRQGVNGFCVAVNDFFAWV